MANKVEFSLKLSAETAARFEAVAGSLCFTRAQTLTYLLDLYDTVEPERAGFPRKRPIEAHIHTYVQPEVRSKFRRLTEEYGLNRDQMLSVLLDIYDQCPRCTASQLTWSSGMGAARVRKSDSTPTTEAETDGEIMSEVDAALDTLRRAFRRMASGDTEIASLREQLAQSRAETQKAEAAYQRMLQAVTARLQDFA